MTADDRTIAEAVRVLRAGGLVAIPTETVYGLAADATNAVAVGRIFTAKGRPAYHPLIVHLAAAVDLDRWAVDAPPLAHRLAAAFWPGPMTLILRRHERVPDVVTGGLETVGLRVPRHPVTARLLAAFGGGLAAPSANRFGRVSPTTAEHVRRDLGDRVDLVLDGGPCEVGIESTIIDLSAGTPSILRPGGVTREAIEDVAGPLEATPPEGVRSPGQLASHYRPRARVELVDAAELCARAAALVAAGRRVAVIATAGPPVPGAVDLRLAPRPEDYAKRLYAALREADAAGVEQILVGSLAAQGLGVAILDRLQKASAR